MSTQRFPRTKYVRRLLAFEAELQGYADQLVKQAKYPRPAREQQVLVAKARELRILAWRFHQLADDMYHMPLSRAELVRRALADHGLA